MSPRTAHRLTLAAVVLLPLLNACETPGTVAQPAPPYRPAPPPVYAAPPSQVYNDQGEIRRCEADNRRSHAEVLALYNRASTSGRINPAEAQQFAALQVRLNRVLDQLNRGGLTLQECRGITGLLASDRQDVLRMSRGGPDEPRPGTAPVPRGSAPGTPSPAPRADPAVARCVADNQRARDGIYATYRDGMRNGRIAPSEAQRFQSIEFRLNELATQSNRGGLSLGECQNISQGIARERAAVDGMLRR